jgi:hypothetical protein
MIGMMIRSREARPYTDIAIVVVVVVDVVVVVIVGCGDRSVEPLRDEPLVRGRSRKSLRMNMVGSCRWRRRVRRRADSLARIQRR